MSSGSESGGGAPPARPAGRASWRASWQRNGDRWLLLAAALALALGLLRPMLSLRQQEHDLVVVLDITQSMNVRDLRLDGQAVSRLEFARAALRRAIPGLPCGSRLGWAIFTEYRSFLLFAPVEVCAHRHELLTTLERIGGRMAWSGNSEIAKGIYGALKIVDALPGKPALVFISDGHEAPPLSPLHRPSFDGKPGAGRGLIVGTGNLLPMPIPKVDPDGRPLGYWKADEVMQTDIYSVGRGGSVGGEKMSESGTAPAEVAAVVGPGGAEHLSALREGYLQLLASETGLLYRRLAGDSAEAAADMLRSALLDRRLGHEADGLFELRIVLALIALLAVLASYRRPSSG